MSNLCQYINPNSGKSCQHKKLFHSNFCYLKSHYPSKKEYNAATIRVMDHFLSISSPLPYSLDNVKIYNPPMNGACLYSCFVKYLIDNPTFLTNARGLHNTNDNFVHLYLSPENIAIADSFLRNVYLMQIMLKDYISEHRDEEIDSNFTWSLLVMECHQMSIEEYDMWYNISADMKDVVNGKIIPSRWGSSVEIIAFSKIFGIDINVYQPLQINDKYEIKECKTYFKNMRIKLLQNAEYSINVENSENKFLSPMNLFLANNHYALVTVPSGNPKGSDGAVTPT